MNMKNIVIELLKNKGLDHLFTDKLYNGGRRKCPSDNIAWKPYWIVDYITTNA